MTKQVLKELNEHIIQQVRYNNKKWSKYGLSLPLAVMSLLVPQHHQATISAQNGVASTDPVGLHVSNLTFSREK